MYDDMNEHQHSIILPRESPSLIGPLLVRVLRVVILASLALMVVHYAGKDF